MPQWSPPLRGGNTFTAVRIAARNGALHGARLMPRGQVVWPQPGSARL